MRVGVLGGGLQGCCTALALAERGVEVFLIDKNDRLLSRAAVANEGKIHLGYMYAGDPTLSTAKTMMAGALSFAPFLERYLGRSKQSFSVSVPATYVVHRDSQRDSETVVAYLRTVHALVHQAAEGKSNVYFGKELSAPLREWSAAEREAAFDPDIAIAAVSTPEIAINPTSLAETVNECILAHPLIEVHTNRTVIGAKQTEDGIHVLAEAREGTSRESFVHVVNALWDGRLAFNQTLGADSTSSCV